MLFNHNKLKAVIEWGFIISGLVFLFLSDRYSGGDSALRIDAVRSFINEGRILNIKYSLLMPIFSIPVYFIGSLFGKEELFLNQFNYIILVITLILSYRLLKEFFQVETLRIFIILVIYASMFTHHIEFFYGELFSACLLFLGVILILKEKNTYGCILLALAAGNQPGIFLGMFLFCVFIGLSKKKFNSFLAPFLALLLILAENYLKYGNIFITGYENDHGFKTIMPYSSLPGFSYPFFFGLISILFSFGKGLLWFTTGIFIPWSWYSDGLNVKSHLFLKSLLIIVVGIILFYSKWWSWYGGYFWGPRYFLFASFPASLILASAASGNKSSILKPLVIICVLILSFWVGLNGVIIGQRNLEFVTKNNYALEFLIWYVPEFSVLWKPFIDGLTLDVIDKIQLIFSLSVLLWCIKRFISNLFGFLLPTSISKSKTNPEL